MSDRVCVIGAGSSGIVTVKTLLQAGLSLDCFEMGSDIGGNWRYQNDNGRSAAYDSLHIDTSKERMAYSDFPMPDDYPDYPHHSQVLRYFESYAEQFDLRSQISFRTRVDRVAADAAGCYRVSVQPLDQGLPEERRYRAVLVCNGHHWDCKLPDFPGHFEGQTLHSRVYRNPHGLEGQNVLVVGIGNSAVDIACDVSRVTRRTFLSSRRSAHIIPRFIWGRPTDQWVSPLTSRLPLGIQRLFFRTLLKLSLGDQRRYGVPEPDFKLLQSHPTLSSELPLRVALGEVIVKPDVAELAGRQVRFEDGTQEPVDVIIYATGYRVSFPFFEQGFLCVRDNRLDLYGRVVDPRHPGLYFIGLIQPLGAIMPLAELQAVWVAGLLRGEMALPSITEMERWIEKDRRALQKRYVPSTRHTLQVDFFPYRRFLLAEMRKARRRTG